ncbi:ribonuclease HII [Paenalcaligenes sp. Me131]|uniref:ribonuclease HII n=1 Tax=Paenalcaligenes sp. Me131 TaxID=3392636 RepID=UPI003D2DF8D5
MNADLSQLLQSGSWVAGVDEAGRGPLAGPVFAAAVILDPNRPIDGLTDSKKLTPKKRDRLAELIREQALAWSISSASREEIDEINILQATMLAMRRACEALPAQPELILIDGNRVPEGLNAPARAVIKGDSQVQAISAASILAKTARDAACLQMHERYPQYAFDQHKGYGTALHSELLREHGPCPEHRRSFAPVQRALNDKASS